MTQTTPTKEQIAEAVTNLRNLRTFTVASADSICNEAADLIEAIVAQLVEARGQLRYQRILTEQIQASHDLAATAAADAAKLLPCPWCATPPLGSPLNNALEPKRSMYLLQCPSGKCPVRPKVYGSDQADAERRWNTRPQPAPPSNPGDTRAHPSFTDSNQFMPGIQPAPPEGEPDFEKLGNYLLELVKGGVSATWVHVELERMYRLGLTRTQGGKP